MGLILDSSLLIAAERVGSNAHAALDKIAQRAAGEEVAISVISVAELADGSARANSPARRVQREQFLLELISVLPVVSVTTSIALRAGKIDGELTASGVKVAFADLLIGVTALELGYRVATSNLRHFESIPNLGVISL